MTIFFEAAVVLGAVVLGARMRSVGPGVMGCLGLLMCHVGCGMAPITPPFGVIMTMLSALMVAVALEAAGTLRLLIAWAERLFARYPRSLTWLSALVAYLLVFFIGSSHIIYILLPVIARAAYKAGVRPVKPLVASVIASQQAILASPFSAATAIVLASHHAGGGQALTVYRLVAFFLPVTLVGSGVAAWSTRYLGPMFPSCPLDVEPREPFREAPLARPALCFFLLGVGVLSCYTQWAYQAGWALPCYFTPLVLFAIAGVILCFAGTGSIVRSALFPIGMQGVIAILGISWLSGSFIARYSDILALGIVRYMDAEWHWIVACFVCTLISSSQGLSLQLLLPLAVAVLGGVPLCVLPAVNSFYFFPHYPTIAAAISLDKTGSTRVGRYVVNHSFMVAGLAGTAGSLAAAYGLQLLLGW